MRLLLDTVTFIWAATSPERISRRAMTALTHPDAELEMSTISLSEIAIKSAIGKLTFSEDDIGASLADLRVRTLSYTAAHAIRLFGLPLHHADPFDRQILAQAFAEQIPVITADDKFKLYRGIKVIW